MLRSLPSARIACCKPNAHRNESRYHENLSQKLRLRVFAQKNLQLSLLPSAERENQWRCDYGVKAQCGRLGGGTYIAAPQVQFFVKPWFHVKMNYFKRILMLYFNMEPRLK